MTINEILSSERGNYADYEIYSAKDNVYNFNFDNLSEALDPDHLDFDYDFEQIAYQVMTEEDYNDTIYRGTCQTADFDWLLGDRDAKMLVITVLEGSPIAEYYSENNEPVVKLIKWNETRNAYDAEFYNIYTERKRKMNEKKRTFIFIKTFKENGKEQKVIVGMTQGIYYPSSLVNNPESKFYNCRCEEVSESCHINI